MTTKQIGAILVMAFVFAACGEKEEAASFGSARGTPSSDETSNTTGTSSQDAGPDSSVPECHSVWFYYDRDGDGVGDAFDSEHRPELGCESVPKEQYVRTAGDCAPMDSTKMFDCTLPPPDIKMNVGVGDKITVAELSGIPRPVKGVVRTVLSGTEPVDLKVRLIGFTPSPVTGDIADPYLLFETDPEDLRWAEWGGAASGMSGSTIILHDPAKNVVSRVAGALSYTYGGRNQAPYVFIATPVERMLEIDALAFVQPTWCPAALPAVSTLMVSGGPDVLALRTGRPSRFDARFVSTPRGGVGSLYSPSTPVEMKAGSAIAVSIARGDLYNASAIGTVTLVDGDKVWAFGHPFTWTGRTRLSFQAAKIDAILSDPLFGAYKIGGAIGEARGVITRDQSAGIAGRFGAELPEEIRVTTRVAAEGSPSSARTYMHYVADLGVVDRTWEITIGGIYLPLRAHQQYVSEGNMRIEMRVSFEETTRTVERTWVVNSSSDIATVGLNDGLAELDTIFAFNGTPTRVEFDLAWVDEVRTFDIKSVEAAASVVAGQNLSVTVTYKLNGEEDNRQATYPLTIPADFLVGPALVSVMAERGSTEDIEGTALDDQIERYNRRGRPQVLEIRLETFGRTHQLLVLEKNEVVNGFASSNVEVAAP